jgi:hypothetical protein
MPPGLGSWPHFDRAIAIGFFDYLGLCRPRYCDDEGNVHIPGGREVEVRRVHTNNEGGWFDYIVTESSNGSERWEKATSYCSPLQENPNFFVLEGCYKYLNAWLDWDGLTPRNVAFPNDVEPMSLASEFYEIVNSRAEIRSAFLAIQSRF